MQDIPDQLDAELATAPEPSFAVADTVTAGRRVLRRRRLATGTAALAVAGTVKSHAFRGLATLRELLAVADA